jgi:hypothetical protein
LENSHPKPERMEETLEGGQVPPRAVAPLERERDMVTLWFLFMFLAFSIFTNPK